MKTTKDFDCVKMMRDIRDKVNNEIVNMDSAQIVEYFRIPNVFISWIKCNRLKRR